MANPWTPDDEALMNALLPVALQMGMSGGGLGGEISGFGKLAQLARKGKITRPWPGIYKGALQEGLTQPASYVNPTTVSLPESAEGLKALLEALGGRMLR